MGLSLIAGIAASASTAIAAGTIFSWAVAGMFALGAGLSMVSRALMPSPTMSAQMGGLSVTTRDAAHSRKIIYGRARIGGNIVYLESTGTDNKYLWLVVAVAGHEIDAYESVWFNDEKIYDGSNYLNNWGNVVDISFYTGNQTAADSDLVSASDDKWTADHKLLDTAYMVLKLTHDVDKFTSGLPNISTIIRGKKVLDPSNNSTAWSQSPALCTYDYLRNAKYGLDETAANILTSSVIAANIICNQDIPLTAGGNQKRYTIDGVVDSADTIQTNIERMLGSMAGRLIYSGGKFEVHAGSYVAPSFTVDESQCVGEISVQTKQSRRNAYNGVKGIFLSETDNYVLADYPAQVSKTVAGSFVEGKRYKILVINNTDFTAIGASANTVGVDFTATGVGSGTGTASLFLAQDVDSMFLDMALPYTTNHVRAQRLAKLALLRSRQQESIVIPCNLSALRFKVGDNINVTNIRLGYSSKIFEVVGYEMDFSSDGQIVVNVQAIETASAIWDWSASDEDVFLGAGEVELYDGKVATPPTNISVTSDSFLADDGTFNSQFKVSWTNADDAFTDRYLVEWRIGNSGAYFSMTTKSSPFQITNLVNDAVYNVQVKAINELGVTSAALTATPTAAKDTTPAGVPTNPSAQGEYRQITVSWTNPSNTDLKFVEVFRSDTVGGTYNYVGNGDTSFIDTDLDTPREYFYKIRSVDFTFNKSAYAAIVSAKSKNVNITAPDNPNVTIYDGDSGLAPSITSARATVLTNTSTFYLKQDYKESLKLHLSYPVGALTSGSVSGQANAINSTMADFKFQVFHAPTSDASNFTQLGADIISVRRTTTGQLISNYFVKTTDLGSGNFRADLQTQSQVQGLFNSLDGSSLGIIDDNYNLRETLVAYDFPAGEYVFKVVVTVTNGSASSYPSTGSPSATLKRSVDAVGYEQFTKTGFTFALKPLYQPITIFKEAGSNEIVRLSEGADTLELSAINSSGVPVQSFVGGGGSSTTTWGARIQFDDDLDTYTNGDIGQFQIGIDKSGTHLSLGTAPSGGGYSRGLNPSLSELRISSGRTDIKGTLYLNGVAVGTGSGSISNVIAGTNLNGGGTSGAVTLNLDSTISGNHTFSNNLVIGGNLTVQGTTTTVDTDNLNVKDKNITLNYSTGNSSSSANGSGITIQDAVDASNNATILWNTSGDKFDFSHKLTAPSLDVGGNIAVTGTVDGVDIGARNGVLTTTTNTANSANTTANAALPKSGGVVTGYLDLTNSTPFIRMTETNVTNTPTWWVGGDSGNFSIRLNNTGAYPLSITTNSTNNAVSAISLGYDTTISGTLTMGSNAISSSGTISSGAITSTGTSTFGRILTGLGTVASPALQVGDNDSGLYDSGANMIGVALGGVLEYDFQPTQLDLKANNLIGVGTISSGVITSTGTSLFDRIQTGLGSVDSPAVKVGDPDSGLYDSGANMIGVALGGVLEYDFQPTQLDLKANNLTGVGTISSGAITSSGTVTAPIINYTSSLQYNGTTLLDNNRNLTNIATISSGAITVKNGSTANISISPTSSGGVLNVRNSSGTSVVVMDGRGTPFIDVTGVLKVGGTTVIDASRVVTASRFVQSSSSGNSFYGAEFTRSGSGTTTPDIWGVNNTLVLGTSSSVEAVGFSGANAQFYGTITSGAITSSGAVRGASYMVGGTTIIDASRNIANVGTISSGVITATADADALKIYTANNGAGADIEFSDQGSRAQKGRITFFHSDGQSYGSGSSFVLSTTEATHTVLADGKLMFKEGLYIKPSSGTGAGTLLISSSGNLSNIGTISSGAITSSGNVTAFSDERLKANVKTLDGKKVLLMRGVSFIKDGEDGSGVIAQELEKVAPELVHDGEKYKSVAYGNITGYLIELAKEQQKEIDELKLLVKQLLEK